MLTSPVYELAVNAAKYNTLLEKSLNEQLSKEELFRYNVLSSYCKTAFDFAKKNKLHLSAYHFDKGDLLLKESKNTLFFKWAALYALPKKAYFLYKGGELASAEIMTQYVINLCGLLRDHGHEYVIFAELQQYQNLARIYFFSKRIEKAIDLCNQCLQLLYSGSSSLTESNYLSDESDPVKDELCIAFNYQLIVETLYTFLKVSKGDKKLISRWVGIFLTSDLINMWDEKRTDPEYSEILTCMGIFQLLPKRKWDHFKNDLSQYMNVNILPNQRLQIVLTEYISLFS